MRLPEYSYAITKSSSTEYQYDMDDEADVNLYRLSQLNRKPIAELLADKMDVSNQKPDYYNNIILSPSDAMKIDEKADKSLAFSSTVSRQF